MMSGMKGVVAMLLAFAACMHSTAQQISATAATRSSESADVESLTLAPGDIITVNFFDNPDMQQQHLRITDDGTVPLLLLGSVKVAGLTPAQADAVIAEAYTNRNLLRNVHVSVTVETYASLNVTVLGYVNGAAGAPPTNGMLIPLPAPKPLLTVLAMAGGLSERASRTVTIQRADRNMKSESVFVSVDPVKELANQPIIYPGDTIVVPRAGIVYILGDVGTAKGVIMEQDGKLSLLEALSLAGSTLPNAKTSKLMIFRKSNGEYHAMHVNMDKIVHGKTPDLQLEAEDVIWVPFSYGKNVLVNIASITAAVSSATASSIIYTHP